MLKMVLGALAALTALVAAPAMAQVTPPAHVKMITVTVGKLEGDKAPISASGKTFVVKLSGCEASWATGDAFYAIATADSNPYIMHKKLMDYAYERSNKDWDTAIGAMAYAKQICLVSPAE
jgi:hypothetical protein